MNLDNALLTKALQDDRMRDAQLRRNIAAVTGTATRHGLFLRPASTGRKPWRAAELQHPTI